MPKQDIKIKCLRLTGYRDQVFKINDTKVPTSGSKH